MTRPANIYFTFIIRANKISFIETILFFFNFFFCFQANTAFSFYFLNFFLFIFFYNSLSIYVFFYLINFSFIHIFNISCSSLVFLHKFNDKIAWLNQYFDWLSFAIKSLLKIKLLDYFKFIFWYPIHKVFSYSSILLFCPSNRINGERGKEFVDYVLFHYFIFVFNIKFFEKSMISIRNHSSSERFTHLFGFLVFFVLVIKDLRKYFFSFVVHLLVVTVKSNHSSHI